MTPTAPAAPLEMNRFHGSVMLDPLRLNSLEGTINQEVIQHLAALLGAKTRITLGIEIEVPDGVPDKVVRDVTENCRTLRSQTHGFEDEWSAPAFPVISICEVSRRHILTS